VGGASGYVCGLGSPVRFSDLSLRLHPPGGDDDEFVERHTEVGFVHQQRPTWPILLAQHVAIDTDGDFDRRYGVRYVT